MGGFFGTVSRRDTVMDVFFGTDYHSHLGTRTAGMAMWSAEGLQPPDPFHRQFSLPYQI